MKNTSTDPLFIPNVPSLFQVLKVIETCKMHLATDRSFARYQLLFYIRFYISISRILFQHEKFFVDACSLLPNAKYECIAKYYGKTLTAFRTGTQNITRSYFPSSADFSPHFLENNPIRIANFFYVATQLNEVQPKVFQ